MKIILPGGAGLVGQNLLLLLKEKGYSQITVIDKHHENIKILKALHPDIRVVEADLAERGEWEEAFTEADMVIMLQAQIGAKEETPFIRNNITSTENIVEVIKNQEKPPFLIHISSSVLESAASDHYTYSKGRQEEIVVSSGLSHTVLRPTLMYGWFDRKHLGWLSRFMQRVPVFPIPGSGRYMRQPLYVMDFCRIILSCMESPHPGQVFNISGFEKIDYIDIIRNMKSALGSRTLILNIPYGLFDALLRIWAFFDRNPPFTVQQLQALVTRDEFEVMDWPGCFNVPFTPFAAAIDETLNHPVNSKHELKF